MPAESTGRTRLAGHDEALTGLVDALLPEMPASTHLPAETRVAADAPAEAVPAEPEAELNDTGERPLGDTSGAPAAAGRVVPDWARDGFRALLFRIGGQRFAMPLLLMRSIAQVPDRLVKLPGRPAWQRGLVRYRGDSVLVADLGLLLGIKAGCAAPRYLLIIGDGRCAFECDSIEDAVPVVSRDVHWGRRTEGRAWLAGLLADRMCALLDADAIAGKIGHG